MDATRFIQIYILQGSLVPFFLFIVYRILKRDTKRLNLIFTGFYICNVIGLVLNFIYAPITNVNIVLVLYFLTIGSFLFSGIFLLIFNLILLKSEKVINTQKQLIIMVIYGVALFFMIIFYIVPPLKGITIDSGTGWKPVWSWLYFLYCLIVVVLGAIAPSLYYARMIYRKFEDLILKKKWQYFIVGSVCIYTFLIGTLLSNTLNIQTIRTIWSVLAFILVIAGPILIYYGVGRQIAR